MQLKFFLKQGQIRFLEIWTSFAIFKLHMNARASLNEIFNVDQVFKFQRRIVSDFSTDFEDILSLFSWNHHIALVEPSKIRKEWHEGKIHLTHVHIISSKFRITLTLIEKIRLMRNVYYIYVYSYMNVTESFGKLVNWTQYKSQFFFNRNL